jgi:hypothetical protein
MSPERRSFHHVQVNHDTRYAQKTIVLQCLLDYLPRTRHQVLFPLDMNEHVDHSNIFLTFPALITSTGNLDSYRQAQSSDPP